MSEQTAVVEKTPENTADSGLSRKKRMALIVYLAILFIVALAVVTLSLVIQIRGNTEQYKTFADKAQLLQEENRELMEERDRIRQAYDLLNDAKDAYAEEDNEAFLKAMETLAPLTENLSGSGMDEYNELLPAWEALQPTETTVETE